jgi:hypothetical protein
MAYATGFPAVKRMLPALTSLVNASVRAFCTSVPEGAGADTTGKSAPTKIVGLVLAVGVAVAVESGMRSLV